MKAALLFALTIISCLPLTAQPQSGRLVITNTTPYYRLSPDGKALCIYETDDNRDKWGMFLNLDNYTWQKQSTISLAHSGVALSPDLNSVYGNSVNYDGFKGDGNWSRYRKYMSWYYPNARDMTKKVQWPDKYFILAKMANGNLLTATGLHFKKVKALAYPRMTASAFSIVNPATGEVVQTLRTFPRGQEFDVADSWIKPSGVFLDNDNLLMWNNMGHYTTLRPADGILHKFTPPVPIYCYAGKYGMGQERKTGSGSDNIIRKVIVNMENGEVVYDQTLSLKGALGYWCAAWGNYFYTLNAQTSLLCKEEWTGSELAIRDSVKLDIKGVLWNDSWGNRNAYNYQLLVSEPAGKVMMLPNVWSEFINPPEALLSWTLRDGQLSLVNPNFIQPSAAYMAKLNRPRLNSVPFNVLIKNYHGLYVVLGQNQTTKKWSVIKYVKDRKGNYERITKEEDAWEFVPAGIEVVSSTACARCKNTGIMATVNRVTSEHTDKMIYNQVTTTTTRDVVGQSTCSDCKGLGFSGIQ